MKQFLYLFFIAFCCIPLLMKGQVAVIPMPNEIKVGEGKFNYSKGVSIKIIRGDDPTKRIVQQLTDSVKAKKINILPIAPGTLSININLQLPANSTIAAEGYTLDITPTVITISSTGNAGLYYGMQSLLQLLRADTSRSLNCMTINDQPAFLYRGLHLDVSRHFFGVDVIKKYLDVMAKLKLNQFHWHLTDDQGWRLEIKKYPKLTEVGAWRTEKNGKKTGGFYTQDEIRQVVQYARERFITVIPEIDLPGHSSAIIAAYPELGCYSKSIDVPATYGIKDDILCPSDSTFQFIKDVMDEVCSLFPGKYIHIGGDEVPTKHWQESSTGKKFALDKSISAKQIQSYFLQQTEDYLAKKDRKCIGWGEIMNGTVSKDVTVMSWRGTSAGIKAAKLGNDVIMTPRQLTYFDYHQDWDEEKKAIYMVYLPLDKVYGFDPLSKVKGAEAQKHILGGQACVWTEYIEDEERLQNQIFPRITALAECVWTKKANKNYTDFYNRLTSLKNYFVKEKELPPVDLVRIKPKKEKPNKE